MIARCLNWSARHRWIVIVAAAIVACLGEMAWRGLAQDVMPDLSDPQIGVVADWMGHPATDVERSVTRVLTAKFDHALGAKSVRGTSMSGMAYIDVVFSRNEELEPGRRAILQQLEEVRGQIPFNVRLTVGPAASSTGWVFEYALFDPAHVSSPLKLRQFQDDVIRPRLSAIPGVLEVASVGGGLQQVLVELKPRAIRENGVAFSDVVSSLRAAVGDPGQPTPATDATLSNLKQLAVTAGQQPTQKTRLEEVARVRVTDDMPTGQADFAGYAAVGGIVVAERNANIPELLSQVRLKLKQASTELPKDVKLVPVYDRLDLVTRVHGTLVKALSEEVLVVVFVILLFLMHGRTALIPLITLPFVLLMTFAAMWVFKVPATIMSFGAIGIALGMAVDADVVALEASHRRLEGANAQAAIGGRRRSIIQATQSVAPAILTSLLITAISFLPVFAFSGESGRLLRPFAMAKTLVFAAAAIVTLTLAPALRDLLIRGRVIPEFKNPLTSGLVRLYRPFVHFVLTRPALTLVTAGLAVASCLPLLPRLGGEFLPRVDEGDLFYMPTTLPGVAPDQAAVQLFWQDHAMSEFGEVETVFGKVGRADTGTDPAPYSMAETTLKLRPRSEWPKVSESRWYSAWAPPVLKGFLRRIWPESRTETLSELVARLDRAAHLPGWLSAWTAPARARMDMMSTGIRTPVGIRIVSKNLSHIDTIGAAVRSVVSRVPGARSASYESLGGETWLTFEPDPKQMAAFNVNPELVSSTADFVTSQAQIGEVELNRRRLRVRVAPESSTIQPRGPEDQLRDITVRSSGTTSGAQGGQPIPLALLGRPNYAVRPAGLHTERGETVSYVYVDLTDGVDVQQFVARARREVDAARSTGQIALLPDERLEWSGQYELLVAGQQKLKWIVPLTLLVMFGLLFLQFRNFTESLIVLAAVPFALVGSIWTIYLSGYPLSAPVWVGLLSTVGLAMQTGVVMVVYIDEAFHARVRAGQLRERSDIVAAHAEGTVLRLRPKLMTITTMAAGLLPMLWAQGAGAEIMRRVAAPMLGGLATSAFLTLEVLPVLYTIWRNRQLIQAQRQGVPIEAIIGQAPPWVRAKPAEVIVPSTRASAAAE